MHARWAAVFLAFASALGLAVAAQVNAAEAQNPDQPGDQPRTILALHSSGMDAMLPSQKDRALRNALHMLSARIMELPGELDDPGIPAPLIAMALEMLMSPMEMRLAVPQEVDDDIIPVHAQLRVDAPNRDAAEQRARMLMEMIRQSGAGRPDGPPQLGPNRMFQRFDLDGTPLKLGMQSGDRAASTILLINQDSFDAAAMPDWPELPGGAQPVIAGHFDFAALEPIIEMAEREAGPEEGRMWRQQLEMWGYSDEHPVSIRFAHGYAADAGVGLLRMANYIHHPTYSSMVVDQPIGADVLDLIPVDATMFEVWRADYSNFPEMMRRWMAPIAQMQGGRDMPDPMRMIDQILGVDLERDVFDHLGTSFGYYLSDSTGGGGLASFVAFAEVENADAFRNTLEQIAVSLNEQARGMARGYVRVQDRRVGDHAITSLTFPGLPIPVELSWTVADGYYWFAASPRALLAAIEHAADPGETIRSNPRFQSVSRQLSAAGIVVQFQDTPVLARRGYGLLNFGMSALSNMLRSPGDLQRDPGLIMPAQADLVRNATASLVVTRIEGDDLLVRWRTDESGMVNLAAGAGAISGSMGALTAIGLGAGVMLPALSEARESAKGMKSMVQLRQIGMGIVTYSHDNEDRLPTSLDQLVEADYIAEDILRSPHGPAWDGDDYWLNPNPPRNIAMIRDPARTMAAYDRAMYDSADEVAVLFYDGHAQLLSPWEVDDLKQELEQLQDEWGQR